MARSLLDLSPGNLDLLGQQFAFFPRSDSHEASSLIKQLYGMHLSADLECGGAVSLRQHQNRITIRFWVKMSPCGSVPGV